MERMEVHKSHQCRMVVEDAGRILSALETFGATNRQPFATTNFVSFSEGSDDNLGDSSSSPWKTLDKVNSVRLYEGDRVLFKRGDVWRGGIVRNDITGVVFGAYGPETHTPPVVDGAIVITNWAPASISNDVGETVSGVYVADLPEACTNYAVRQLIVDAERQTLARHPNSMYFLMDSDATQLVTGSSYRMNEYQAVILDDPQGYWSNALVCFRYYSWNMFYGRVTWSSNGLLHVCEDVSNPTQWYVNAEVRPYFIQDHIHALDTHGEWYYDAAASKLYLCWTNDELSAHSVEASIHAVCVSLSNANNVVVQDLRIDNAAMHGIYVMNPSAVTVASNTIRNTRLTAITMYVGTDCHTVHNRIESPGNEGVYYAACYQGSIRDNTLASCFMNTFSEDDCGTARAIEVYAFQASNCIIADNSILSCGYSGINFNGHYSIVEGNFISNACAVFDDGGGIYSYFAPCLSDHSRIRKNIIVDTRGPISPNWGGYWPPAVHGIYMDYSTDAFGNAVCDLAIESNTIIRSHSSGIILKDSRDSVVCGNTLHANAVQTCLGCITAVMLGNSYRENTHVGSESAMQIQEGYRSTNAVSCDLNTYSAVDVCATPKVNWLNFSTWTNEYYPQDSRSVDAGAALTSALDSEVSSCIWYNPTTSNIVVPLDQTYYDLEANQVTTAFALQAHTSRVLCRKLSGQQVSIVTSMLSPVELGGPCWKPLYAKDGVRPYSWGIASGNLPNGLWLSSNGVLQGTPLCTGVYAFIVNLADARNDSTNQPLSLSITVPQALQSGGVIGNGHGGLGSF